MVLRSTIKVSSISLHNFHKHTTHDGGGGGGLKEQLLFQKQKMFLIKQTLSNSPVWESKSPHTHVCNAHLPAMCTWQKLIGRPSEGSSAERSPPPPMSYFICHKKIVLYPHDNEKLDDHWSSGHYCGGSIYYPSFLRPFEILALILPLSMRFCKMVFSCFFLKNPCLSIVEYLPNLQKSHHTV